MVQMTVLKVRLSSEKCKKKILKSVSDIDGVDKIEIDTTKDTLTVTGDADPYMIIIKARKVIKCVEVVTIGPPPKKPEEKKPEEKKPVCICIPPPYVASNPVAVVHMTQEPCTTCSIM
ncbi:putative heavy metal-associated domain, HMA, heavy metal-associated domain superfamily [Helianthus annuus]|uniref:Heavy metal-associated domain, HMA, heavy metal-associated domain superfamily n=1 Tax=Helianthus annuus TaxID=4232 RepID=A0A9K3H7J5_HELAN|nr:heavy metal-associated isoprenylated plant protein 43-like [Helianthus annuus]KAF5768928.1 putative heavy metal-associated domain, HMA, heavy metal-associated domain superfamily [Helianthus annuus]KAJ0840225.1 putative heavy metal-associated domain, HMA, heavy metal-associated domain superfamily [Helianthus annuus]